jgi:hypothetical protein
MLVINAERVSMQSPAFSNPLRQTRLALLNDLIQQYVIGWCCWLVLLVGVGWCCWLVLLVLLVGVVRDVALLTHSDCLQSRSHTETTRFQQDVHVTSTSSSSSL